MPPRRRPLSDGPRLRRAGLWIGSLRSNPMRAPETATTMGSAAMRTNATRAASTETPAECTSEAKLQAHGWCDVLGVLEPTGNAPMDVTHQNADAKVHARNRQIVGEQRKAGHAEVDPLSRTTTAQMTVPWCQFRSYRATRSNKQPKTRRELGRE